MSYREYTALTGAGYLRSTQTKERGGRYYLNRNQLLNMYAHIYLDTSHESAVSKVPLYNLVVVIN